VRALLAKGAAVDTANTDGATALVAAAYGGHVEATRALLDGGADASVKDKAGRTPLMASALGGNAASMDAAIQSVKDALVLGNASDASVKLVAEALTGLAPKAK